MNILTAPHYITILFSTAVTHTIFFGASPRVEGNRFKSLGLLRFSAGRFAAENRSCARFRLSPRKLLKTTSSGSRGCCLLQTVLRSDLWLLDLGVPVCTLESVRSNSEKIPRPQTLSTQASTYQQKTNGSTRRNVA